MAQIGLTRAGQKPARSPDSVRAIAPCQIRRSVLQKLARHRRYLLTLPCQRPREPVPFPFLDRKDPRAFTLAGVLDAPKATQGG